MEERHQQHTREVGADPAVEGYDAVPRDGPAVFIADTHRLDRGELHGRWIGLDQTAVEIAAGISEVTERSPIAGGWAVVDQVRVGGVMCDEDLTFDALTRLAALHREQVSEVAR